MKDIRSKSMLIPHLQEKEINKYILISDIKIR